MHNPKWGLDSMYAHVCFQITLKSVSRIRLAKCCFLQSDFILVTREEEAVSVLTLVVNALPHNLHLKGRSPV